MDLMIAYKVVIAGVATMCLLAAGPTVASDVSTSEFLSHCEAAPEPCKDKVLAYVKFLAEGGLLDQCVMQQPAAHIATKLIGWMRDHTEYAEKDWVDCLDDAISTLKLCNP